MFSGGIKRSVALNGLMEMLYLFFLLLFWRRIKVSRFKKVDLVEDENSEYKTFVLVRYYSIGNKKNFLAPRETHLTFPVSKKYLVIS